MSSREEASNRVRLFAIVAVTTVGLFAAVGLGVFSASPEPATVAELVLEAAAESTEGLAEADDVSELAITTRELEEEDAAQEEKSGAASFAKESARAAQRLAEIRLQEVRDTYLRFEQGFEGLSLHYASANECEGAATCLNPSSSKANEILVDPDWARDASPEDLAYALAQAHAELAIQRIWPDRAEAAQELGMIVPACQVLDEQQMLEAAGVPVVQVSSFDAPIEAMKDIITAQMVSMPDRFVIYPSRLHTDEQKQAAQQISHAHEPEVVLQVSSAPACDQ
jgi:hypothetical protein